MKPLLSLRRLAAPATGAPQVVIDDAAVEHLTRTFKLLADSSRLKILLGLRRSGEMHVSALCKLLGQSQPAVSHHLMLLKMASLVQVRRAGRHNFYSLDEARVGHLLAALAGDDDDAIQPEPQPAFEPTHAYADSMLVVS